MECQGRRREDSVTAHQVAITSWCTTDKKMQFLFLFVLEAQTYLTYRVNRAFLWGKLLMNNQFQTSSRISPGEAIGRDKERNRHHKLKRNLLPCLLLA
jgi:hypothetical protein